MSLVLILRYTRRDFASAIPTSDSQVGSTTGRYSPEIFTYYKSVSEAGNLVIAKQKNILLNPKMLIAFFLIVVLLAFSGYRIVTRGVFGQIEAPKQIQGSSDQSPSPSPSSSAPSLAFPSVVGYSSLAFPAILSICVLRLSDGSSRIIKASRLPGGMIFDNGRVYLPGAAKMGIRE